jgi:hypothetical protein
MPIFTMRRIALAYTPVWIWSVRQAIRYYRRDPRPVYVRLLERLLRL